MRSVSPTWIRVFILTGFLSAVPMRAAAQEEKPVSPDALNQGSALGEDSSRRLSITGFGVATYTYDFRSDENSFGDSALAVALSKVISDHLSVFAQLTASREPDSPFIGGETHHDIETDIDNLQLTWLPSARSGLAITFGKFDSPLAIERDDAPLNFQATNSFTFDFARPVKFTGLQIHESFSEHFEGFAILANGWDVDADNNKGKTGALYGLWSPTAASHFGLGVIYGPEKDDRTGDPRTTAVATALVQPTASWVLGGEGVVGEEPHSSPDGGTARWYAGEAFSHYRFAEHWGATLRLDYLDDRDGSRTGTPQVLRSVTLSPQYLFGGSFFGIYRYLDRTSLRLPELSVRLDLRYDRSSEATFRTRQEDEGSRDHFSVTLQTVFLF